MEPLLLSRRDFTRFILRLCAYGGVIGGAINIPRRAQGETTDALELRVFDRLEYQTVEAAAVILLGTAVVSEARVALYVDHFLGAFAEDPPRIYAGGPFSGRHGGAASFAHFLPLSPLKAKRWQSYLDDIQRKYHAGLTFLNQRSRTLFGDDYPSLRSELQETLLASVTLSPHREFLALLFQHAVEGMWCDPVYGGNAGFKGWTHVGFVPGDIQPTGYTESETSDPDPGAPELAVTPEVIDFLEQLRQLRSGGLPDVQ